MKILVSLLSLFILTTGFAQVDQKLPNGQWAYYGSEFYSAVTSKKKIDRSLFNRIFNEAHQPTKGKHDEIKSQCNSHGCYRHFSVGYTAARKIMFGELDILRDSEGTYVRDVYCGKKFYFRGLDEVSGMHTRVNIEHTWPQSKFNGNFSKDMQKSDMHHLYLTDSNANSRRGNIPFGLVRLDENEMVGEGCDMSRFGFTAGGDTYTPPPAHRGNVARSLFYFAMHYNLGISSREEATLRRWHKDDPVDQNEIIRHEKIAKHQNVRNPFVDHPQIVDLISDF